MFKLKSVRNRKGAALILGYMLILVLSLFVSVFFNRTLNEKRVYDFDRERLEAFYIAEAGVDRAMTELRSNYAGYSGTGLTTLGQGQYEISVVVLSGSSKKILSYSYVPNKAQKRAQRNIEVITKKLTPADFYDYAIYSANDIICTGNSYDVTGKAIYADALLNGGRISGGSTQDPTVSPLARFDFAILRAIAVSQGNLFTATRLGQGDPFPTDFWFSPPTNPSDPTTGIPNVVYVEGAMTLTGNDVVGGFFLVVGNILTNPEVIVDTSLKGNITVNGCIYTTGQFTAKGGGNAMNVTGGIWAGTDVNLNGNVKIAYDTNYMMSIKSLVDTYGASGALQVLSWREL
jgi:hypothetical protein